MQGGAAVRGARGRVVELGQATLTRDSTSGVAALPAAAADRPPNPTGYRSPTPGAVQQRVLTNSRAPKHMVPAPSRSPAEAENLLDSRKPPAHMAWASPGTVAHGAKLPLLHSPGWAAFSNALGSPALVRDLTPQRYTGTLRAGGGQRPTRSLLPSAVPNIQ